MLVVRCKYAIEGRMLQWMRLQKDSEQRPNKMDGDAPGIATASRMQSKVRSGAAELRPSHAKFCPRVEVAADRQIPVGQQARRGERPRKNLRRRARSGQQQEAQDVDVGERENGG